MPSKVLSPDSYYAVVNKKAPDCWDACRLG